MAVLFISLAPIFIISIFIYYKDKYEPEPIRLIIKALMFGALISFPIIFIEKFLSNLDFFSVKLFSAGYQAFVVAGFTEELFKFAVLYFLIWKNKEFNERFDGIVYAVFVSLGFAMIENVYYVLLNGFNIGVLRAFTAVPAHTLFGISMGYYFGEAKFSDINNKMLLFKALCIPIILHGIYDFLIFADLNILLALFIPYLIFMIVKGLKQMRLQSEKSVFKNNFENKDGQEMTLM